MRSSSSTIPRRCDGVSRRDFLHLGTLASLGFGLTDLFRWQARGAGAGLRPSAPATSCILIWLDGGPSHLDTFDPKPEAPAEIRGPFSSIPTAVPGLHLCEHLPRTAKIMGEVALIRSLTHELGNHDTGTRFLLTGHRPTPALQYPSLGSVLAHHHGPASAMPPYVAIPSDAVGGESGAARAGYLPGAFAAFNAGQPGAVGNRGSAPDLDLPEGVSFDRSDRRHAMLLRLDQFGRTVDQAPAAANRDAFYAQAYRLLTSPPAKRAFDLSAEPLPLRERYGPSRLGNGCLLARRLVEAGARFVTVVDTGWDTHQQIARELPDSRFAGSGKLPALDLAYSALLADLRDRGLLATTLVVLMGEFGRTPKLNALGGRDHWPRAGFAALAGAGIPGGQVIGATDAFGEVPSARPVGPPDLAFTILRLLGVDPTRELVTPAGRPLRILNEGSMIEGLV